MPPAGKEQVIRTDLHTASRCLGLTQRVLLREHLHRVGALLGAAETVRLLAPARWRSHRAVAVLTDTRLLLVRRPPMCSPTDHASFPFHRITHLTVHPVPPQGARVRIMVGLDLEEFSITGSSPGFENALRDATA